MSEERYWHFLPDDGRLRYGRRIRVKAGSTYRARGRLALCKNGMHASRRVLDALHYAPGAMVCRVTLGDETYHGGDKSVARSRTVLWMADATRTLHEFAIWCAERALTREREAEREPDPRSWAALEVKRCWLDGAATDEELTAAHEAAAAAARGATAAQWAAAAAQWAAAAAARGATAAQWTAWAAAALADDSTVQNEELTRRLLALAPAGWEEDAS